MWCFQLLAAKRLFSWCLDDKVVMIKECQPRFLPWGYYLQPWIEVRAVVRVFKPGIHHLPNIYIPIVFCSRGQWSRQWVERRTARNYIVYTGYRLRLWTSSWCCLVPNCLSVCQPAMVSSRQHRILQFRLVYVALVLFLPSPALWS